MERQRRRPADRLDRRVLPHPPATSTDHSGENDEIFGADGARAYARDLPDAEIHLLNAGHFALETHGPEIVAYIRDFLGRTLR